MGLNLAAAGIPNPPGDFSAEGEARAIIDLLQANNMIPAPEIEMLVAARDKAVAAVKK